MTIAVLRRSYELQRKHCDAPVFNGPLELIRALQDDLRDLANLLGNPQILRLVVMVAAAGSALRAALERSISEHFVESLGEHPGSAEPSASALLGGLVVVEFMSLLTPSSGQVKLGEATKEFADQLGGEATLVQMAVGIIAKVGNEAFTEYRVQVRSFLDKSLAHLDGSDESKVLANLEREAHDVLTRWHAKATRFQYE